ncbi:MAG TPA: AgmX/PglI C-terminal domain-containing protein [Polyangiaceae bacterium]
MSRSGFTRGSALMGLTLLGACGSQTPAQSSADSADAEHSARQASVSAELTPAEIVIKLRGNETDIRRCFFANPSARGTLSLSWRVNTQGRIEQLKRESSTLDDPRIAQCLGEKLYDVRFDPRAEPARARWTFVFRLIEAPRSGSRHRSPSKRQRDQREATEQGVQLEKTSPGTLDLGAVDNVVESGFPLFARCYRDGVSRNSNLDGAVRLRFIVGEQGMVTTVEDGGSDLTDRQVVDCVAEGFYALRFPEPAKGDAHLIYRIHFDSG